MAALARTHHAWTRHPWTLLNVVGHGRDVLGDELDVARTVGWFTTSHPLIVHASRGDLPSETLRSVEEQVSRVPGRGESFGLLRYLGPDLEIRRSLRELPAPELNFNFLGGQLRTLTTEGGGFRIAAEAAGRAHSPRSHLPFPLALFVFETGTGLTFRWVYSVDAFHASTIERLAAIFEAELVGLLPP
jgi:non-ribosomal peptide synthase protein (TIGR01720 family)